MVAHLYRRPDGRRTALGGYLARLEGLRDRCAAEVAFASAVRLRRSDALMQAVFQSTSEGVVLLDADGRVQVANAAAALLLGQRIEALLDRPITDVLPDSAAAVREGLQVAAVPSRHQENVIRRSDGSEAYLEVGVSAMRYDDEIVGIVLLRDITDRRLQQRQLEYQALHDALTGLPNRVLFLDRLEMALAQVERSGEPLALLMLDLDRFKEVNDTLGHFAGDALLREIATRLSAVQRATDTIARLGGDEFAVLVPSITALADARDVARRIADAVVSPFYFDGLMIEVGVSVGIALAPEHAREKDKLLQCADVAMYAAKQEQTGCAVYNLQKDCNSVRHLTVTGQLRRAIEEREISLVYQPQLSFATLECDSVEALARWDHPMHGAVLPAEFILHAERTGLIHDLTVLILKSAVEQVARWREQGLHIHVAVNISAKALHDSAFPRLVADTLRGADVDARWLTLEITESAIMRDPLKALRIARTIAEMGLSLSIDDFGTGYSSLSYLSNLPASELKIDKSFVSRMGEKAQDAAIVQSTIDLAHNLGLKVVAEGIENLETLSHLARLGCDHGQGYYICEPTDPEALTTCFRRPLSNDLLQLATRRQQA